MLSQSGFDLPFLIADNVGHHAFLLHLFIFGKMFIQILCPVSVGLFFFFVELLEFSYQINDLLIFSYILWVIFSLSFFFLIYFYQLEASYFTIL